jgi:uncharacterized protein (DUF2384 family)
MSRAKLEMDLASAVLGWAERELALTAAEIAQAFRVDRTTIYHLLNRDAVPTPEQRRRVEQFAQLKRLLEDTFRTPEVGRQWLLQGVPALQGRTPISVITDGDIDNVLGLLATHAAGVYI